LRGCAKIILSDKGIMAEIKNIVKINQILGDPLPGSTSLLVSFPRSGNHAFRYIIEKLTHSTTIGCQGVRHNDLPIYIQSDCISNADPTKRPSFVKCHFLKQIYKDHLELGHFENYDNLIVFIFRDPVEAISSHCESFVNVRRLIRSIQYYFALVELATRLSKRNTVIIQYSEMINASSIFAGQLQNLINQKGLDARPITKSEVSECLAKSKSLNHIRLKKRNITKLANDWITKQIVQAICTRLISNHCTKEIKDLISQVSSTNISRGN